MTESMRQGGRPATRLLGLPPATRSEVGLSALAQPRLTKVGQPYLETMVFTQRETGDRMIGWGLLCPQQTFRFPVSP
ncbi:MAG: hypothetical protein CAK86_03860 [Opitutia bacterium AMD-G1]|nr:MAG: hypothetical protein CAK86_03860 [Opitutae bacterium AMD-G1]